MTYFVTENPIFKKICIFMMICGMLIGSFGVVSSVFTFIERIFDNVSL